MYIMEEIYKINLESSLSKTIPDVVAYSFVGFISCSIFENILPVFNLKKDSISILLEILTQLIMITFIYMFVSTKVSGRHSIIIFAFIAFACQPTLVDKINLIQDRIFGSKILEIEQNNDVKQKNTETSSNNTTTNDNKNINKTETKLIQNSKSNIKKTGATSINNLPMN